MFMGVFKYAMLNIYFGRVILEIRITYLCCFLLQLLRTVLYPFESQHYSPKYLFLIPS